MPNLKRIQCVRLAFFTYQPGGFSQWRWTHIPKCAKSFAVRNVSWFWIDRTNSRKAERTCHFWIFMSKELRVSQFTGQPLLRRLLTPNPKSSTCSNSTVPFDGSIRMKNAASKRRRGDICQWLSRKKIFRVCFNSFFNLQTTSQKYICIFNS